MEAQTSRLILRRFTPADAERLFQIYSDAETMKFMGRGPATVDDERDALSRHIESYYDRYGFGLWGVVNKVDDSLIGRCGIVKQEIGGHELEELSYLIDRESWGHGFATEAAQAVIELASKRYGLEKLIALILPENIKSIRVARKCGFELEQTVEKFKIWRNVRVYGREL